MLYDGDCGFCNRSVAFVLKHEKNKEIYFASLQSDFTQQLFLKHNWKQPDLSTVYFIENEMKFEKSSAIIRIAKNLKSPQSWGAIIRVFPRKIRDFWYDLIAKNRNKITKNYCFVPKKEDKGRFLN